MLQKLKQYKDTIYFSQALALLLLIIQFLEYNFLIRSFRLQFYIGIIALLFTGIGIWIAIKIRTPKTEIIFINKEIEVLNKVHLSINQEELNRLKISKRELEVLGLMAQGLSNQEIADQLFISLNTVKTHVSNTFEKLEVKRRTQAVETVKRLQLISDVQLVSEQNHSKV